MQITSAWVKTLLEDMKSIKLSLISKNKNRKNEKIDIKKYEAQSE